jgi:hypothetical protein
MRRIGKAFTSALVLFCIHAGTALAGIQASVDRQEVPQDESVSLKITRTGENDRPLNPKFDAPDFEIVNQFQNSQFSSVYINGKFENRSEESVTFILRPLKVGALRIRNISNNGEKASDITVQVIQEQLNRKQVQGEGSGLKGDAKNFFVRGEVSTSRVYKGEQVIVSFYLYRRTRAQVRDVLQYPSFQGFIREDLEMPILSNRPDFEAVSYGGVPMERALLARYAIYPIKEGKLKVDGFAVKVDYVPKNPSTDEMLEDPVFQFFTQVTPRSGSSRSDPILIDVQPLPEEGKSPLFTGGVGNFEVSAQLDSNRIQAHAPLNFKVSVKGKGNTSLVEFPKVNWPKGLRLYESQGKSKSLGQGLSEKVFEVVVIPELAGSMEIPPVEFEFFNPESRAYVRRKTAAIPIVVAPGDPSQAPAAPRLSGESADRPDTAPPAGGPSYGAIRERDKSSEGFGGQPWWRLVAWAGLLMFFFFAGMVVWDQTKKRSLARLEVLKRKQNVDRFWASLAESAQKAVTPQETGRVLEQLKDEVYKSLDEGFDLSSRALPKRELARILTEQHSLRSEDWQTLDTLFETAERIRFSSQSGEPGISGERVKDLVDSVRKICAGFPRKSMEIQA